MQPVALSLLISGLMLTACSEIPRQAYFNRGDPAHLLDVSNETTSIPLGAAAGISQLTDWVNQDQPSRAELYCIESNPPCHRAMAVFDQFDIDYEHLDSAENRAVLVYERVLARDCDQRYVDNPINPYNLHHQNFGCAVSANIVQHVSDKKQLVDPNLLDYSDGAKAAQVYGVYMTPPKEPSYEEGDSQLSSGGSGGGGSGGSSQ